MGDRYYGKTKKGEHLCEADAKAKGTQAPATHAASVEGPVSLAAKPKFGL